MKHEESLEYEQMKKKALEQLRGGWFPDGTPLPQSEIDAMNARVSSTLSACYATTDFIGVYTLAKKL